jgi:hypothetical protein
MKVIFMTLIVLYDACDTPTIREIAFASTLLNCAKPVRVTYTSWICE